MFHSDGYLNTIIGHGLRNRDPFTAYRFHTTAADRMSWDEAEDLYTYNGIAQKIIKAPADEAVRAGFVIKDGDSVVDDNSNVQSALEDLQLQSKMAEALAWDRLYGGAAIVMLIDDGGELDEPLAINRVRKIDKLLVFDAQDIDRNNVVFYDDPRSPHYGMPEVYGIVGYNGNSFTVHESRLLLFDGGMVSNRKRRQQNGWGATIFDGVQDFIQHYATSLSLSNMALHRLSQSVVKLAGLSTLLSNDFGEQQVQRRLQAIDMARHMMNSLALDSEDEYDLKNLSLAGIPAIVEKFENALCAATDIPATILFGRSPEGQNSTGHSDFENYYNMIGRIQQRKVRPQLVKLLTVVNAASDYKISIPAKYTIEFNPLWNLSDKEKAETENIAAQAREHDATAARTYHDLGALDALEIRDKLDADDVYTLDRSLDKIINTPPADG